MNSAGDVFVTGSTKGSMDGNSNSGYRDIVLIKFSSSGAWQWTRQRGTGGGDRGYGVAVNSEGDIFVAGDTKGSMDGNPNSGSYDIALIKFSSTGDWQWTKQHGTSSSDRDFEIRPVS